MAKEPPYLNFHDPVQPYPRDDVAAAFWDMRAEMSPAKSAESFYRAARQMGTHLPKLIAPRQKGAVLSEPGKHPVWFSGNAGETPAAKAALRPIAISGAGAPRCLVEHMVEPDELSSDVLNAFEEVFGGEALQAIRDGLAEARRARIGHLKGENFPIVYVPGDEDGIQITPVPPAAAIAKLQDIARRRAGLAQEAGDPRLRGSWFRPEIADKAQNAAPQLRGNRKAVLRARMPAALRTEDAAIYRFLRGGPFPAMRDTDVADRLVAFADRLARHGQDGAAPMTPEIQHGLAQRARSLIATARGFIDRIAAEAEETAGAEIPDTRLPEEREILARVLSSSHPWHARVVAALDSTFFQEAEREIRS